MSPSLQGRVALVGGATRGAGRGIAVALGAAGATVYCSGRSVRGASATAGRPETIEETAELVSEAGGEGLWAQTDHTEAAQVEALVARIRHERGRLDILVNDVWGGDALTEWGTPFWKLDLAKGFTMLDRAVRAHIITSRYAVPLMLERRDCPGLIVEITDGDEIMNRHYRDTMFYDIAKTVPMRLAFGMAHELRDRGITAVAVTPGFLRSEAMLDHFRVTADTWQDAVATDPNFAHSETPAFVGRAVAALAADPNVFEKTGRSFASWTLSEEYGFDDADGRRPHWGRHFESRNEELWSALVEAVHAATREAGLEPAVDVRDDVDAYTLSGRIPAAPERWFPYHLGMDDVWFGKPAEVAKRFVARWRDARTNAGS